MIKYVIRIFTKCLVSSFEVTVQGFGRWFRFLSREWEVWFYRKVCLCVKQFVIQEVEGFQGFGVQRGFLDIGEQVGGLQVLQASRVWKSREVFVIEGVKILKNSLLEGTFRILFWGRDLVEMFQRINILYLKQVFIVYNSKNLQKYYSVFKQGFVYVIYSILI